MYPKGPEETGAFFGFTTFGFAAGAGLTTFFGNALAGLVGRTAFLTIFFSL